MASAYDHAGLSACVGQNTSQSCGDAIAAFTSRFQQVGNLIGWVTLVPGLIGILLAAPFILQLEHGTNRLDWTQSITRGRWIGDKLGLAIGAALVASLALTLLIGWWRAPLAHFQGRMDNSAFDSDGIVVFGYTLFALGLALAVGVVWRRAAAGLIVAFIGYFAARLFVDNWLRQRLLTPLSSTWKVDGGPPPANLDRAWILRQYPSDAHGNAVSFLCPGVHEAHPGVAVSRCIARGVVHPTGYMHTVYHPASHFWPLQGIETALFGAVALVLIGFAAWWTHERSA
jgi:hypothetical protein